MKTFFATFSVLLAMSTTGQGQNRQSTLRTISHVQNTRSLDDDIGEMLLVGFRGVAVDSTDHIWRDLRDYHVGSVILFDYDVPTGTRGRNITDPQQVQSLCSQLRSSTPPSSSASTRRAAGCRAASIHATVPRHRPPRSFVRPWATTRAPLCTLTARCSTIWASTSTSPPWPTSTSTPTAPSSASIERSFSSDTAKVTQCCNIWIDEQRKAGVASCLKHFPGHGSAKGDTHKGLVDVTKTWRSVELQPLP